MRECGFAYLVSEDDLTSNEPLQRSLARGYGSVSWAAMNCHTGFIEGWIFYALVATLPGLSNAALGFLAAGLTSLATTGLSIALNMAFQQKPPTPKAQDIQSNIRQGLSARRRHYWRTKVGSVVVFGFRRGEKLYILHYIGEGPIEGFVSFFLDRKPVTLDVNGFVDEYPSGQFGADRVRILTKLGTMADEPFDEIIDAFPELDRPLKPFRARGCAMVLQIVEEVNQTQIMEVYPNNLPSLEVIIDGMNELYDPRTETEALSGNAGICLLAETMNVYGLTSASTEDIDFDAFGDFADHCDEAVDLKAGGTEPRYLCVGTILMDAENEHRIKAIANICNADVYMNPEGKISVRKRLSSTPSIELKAEDGDHLSISLESGRREQKKFNAVKVVYREALLNWKENEAYYRNAAAKLADGGKELVEPMEAGLCPSGTQAQRLGKLFFHEMNPDTVGTMLSGAQALELIADPVFTLDLAPEDDLQFVARAGGIEFDASTQSVSFQLQSVDPDAEEWDAATEEQDVVEIPPLLPSNVDDLALDVTATVALLANSAPVINFSWELDGGGAVPDAYSQQVQVSVADADEWLDATVNQEERTARFGPVADNAAYDWRIRNIRGGRQFDWQLSVTPVTVVVDTVAPLALASFTLTGSAPRLGNAAFSVTTASDTHLSRIHLYRVPTGVTLDKDVHDKITIGAAPGTTFGYVDGDATRTNMFANPTMAADTDWTKGTGWTWGAGVFSHAAGSAGGLSQAQSPTPAETYRYAFDITAYTAGEFSMRFSGGTSVLGAAKTSAGTHLGSLLAATGNNLAFIRADAAGVGSADNACLYQQTAACAPQGAWDFHPFPANISGVEGPAATPIVGVVIV